jgi:tetratricopeptide (TPR) repeat protein
LSVEKDEKAAGKRIAALYRSGDLDVAEASRLAVEYPNSLKVQRTLAKLCIDQDRPEEAAVALKNVLRLAPDDRKARLQLADGLSNLHRPADALAVLRPLADAEPTSKMFLALAQLHRRLGHTDEAEGLLRKAVEVNPGDRRPWAELIDLLEVGGRRQEARDAAAARDETPAKLSAREVVERIDDAHPGDAERFVVNIGCNDGRSAEDPCYDLFQAGYPGLAIDSGDFPALHENLPQPEVRKLLNTPVTPTNVVDVLEAAGCPRHPSLIKVDIDSFDGVLLAAALEGFAPNVIQIEVNPEIPPPLRFAIQYDPRYRPSGRAGFYGCSVSYVASLGRRFGYELLEIDFTMPPFRQDVILVREEYLQLWDVERPVDERTLWLAEPIDLGRFYQSGVDTVGWRSETDFQALLSKVWDACAAASIRRSGVVLPFVLNL